MANNRPIRVPPHARRRWRRGPQRPKRWIEGNSHNAEAGVDACSQATNDLVCDSPQTPRILIAGDSDFEWADRSEVRVDRIIGQLSWHGVISGDTPTAVIPYVLRFGVLALEENENLFPAIDLFDREALEEFQWMWLYQTVGDCQYSTTPESASIFQSENIPIDIRTRRSIGKKDNVVLYAAYKQMGMVSFANLVGRNPQYSYQLRTILRS